MARIPNIMLAKSKIEQYFDNNDKIIYGIHDLMIIFNSNNKKWNLCHNLSKVCGFFNRKIIFRKN